MDLTLRAEVEHIREELLAFMDECVYPAEAPWAAERARRTAEGRPLARSTVLEELKADARSRGLWNLFLPDEEHGRGLSNVEYAPIAEITGRSLLAPEALNCNPPDSGNMEILGAFGTPEQQKRWLEPLLDGRIRSCFAMTEPAVASSDATNISTTIERQGDEYVINGRKWWITGGMREDCAVAIVMGRSDASAPTYRSQSMVLVPMDTPGVRRVRDLPVFGHHDHDGHAELELTDVRVPVANVLGAEGDGFTIAQSRLGPGRIHHCMRAIGAAERAFELMCRRAHERYAFGRTLADQGLIQSWIADSRVEIEQARLLTQKTAWLIDTVGNRSARREISAIKIAVPRSALAVVDRAIQVHGGAGVSEDTPLASMFSWLRCLRIADGPDEVHQASLAKAELRRFAPKEVAP